MLSKNKIKLINKLKTKKGREETGLFIVEGEKMIAELLMSNFDVDFIAGFPEWFEKNSFLIKKSTEVFDVDEITLKKASSLSTPNKVIAVARIKEYDVNYRELEEELSLVLDTIQDPGNLGTIIRTSNWFGIKTVICSTNSADVYNPKVIQATMGAIFRVKILYSDLVKLFQRFDPEFPIFGTFLEGENINSHNLSKKGFIVFGNESKGISKPVRKFINHKITIPSYPKNQKTMESLNITSAAAIVCSEFRKGMQ